MVNGLEKRLQERRERNKKHLVPASSIRYSDCFLELPKWQRERLVGKGIKKDSREIQSADHLWHSCFPTGGIYLIEQDGLLKLGKAARFHTRLTAYVQNPNHTAKVLGLLGCCPLSFGSGSMEYFEDHFHSDSRLTRYRVSGEWYEKNDWILKVFEGFRPRYKQGYKVSTGFEHGTRRLFCDVIEGVVSAIEYNRLDKRLKAESLYARSADNGDYWAFVEGRLKQRHPSQREERDASC